jgi:hypothetical protein
MCELSRSKSPDWLFKNQFTKDYYAEYFKVTESMFVKPREFRFLKKVPGYFTAKKEE